MASIKKLSIFGIFISILCIFAMSHNASAINLTLDLNKYSLKRSIYATAINCEFVNVFNQSANDTNNYCLAYGNNNSGQAYTGLNHIYTTNTYDVENGDILNFYLYAYSEGTNGFQGDLQVANITNAALGWNVLDFKLVDSGEISPYSQNGGTLNAIGSNYNINFDTFNFSGYYRIYEITLISVNKGSKHLGLNNTAGSLNPLFRFPFDSAYSQRYGFRLSDLKIYTFTGDEANKEVEEKTQEAVDDSQNAGSSSSSSAQQGGANLLSAITGFFNVITSAQPSNCRFNAPLNTYFGNERLNVDLCALDLPSGIGALTSIIAIGILIPFAIHMFNKFIALFRSFQS